MQSIYHLPFVVTTAPLELVCVDFFFRFEVPVAAAKPPTTELSIWDRAAGSETSDPGRFRILVAEDNRVNRLVALQQLRALGYRVQAVENGHQALHVLARERFDLVLMDCQMPELDGYEATRRIRRREREGSAETPAGGEPVSALKRLPVIAITAHAMKGDREKCLAAGMDDYIAKPFRADQIAAVLRRWLSSDREAVTDRGSGETNQLELETVTALSELGRETGTDLLGRVISAFLREAPTQLQALSRALAAGDRETAAQFAHSLRGGAAQLGAARFSRLCTDLREAVQQPGEPADGGDDLLARLEGEFEGLVAELEELKELSATRAGQVESSSPPDPDPERTGNA